MSTYVISCIQGCFDELMGMIKIIGTQKRKHCELLISGDHGVVFYISLLEVCKNNKSL